MRWLWGATALLWCGEFVLRHGLAWSGAGQIVLSGGSASVLVAAVALLWLGVRLALVAWTGGLAGISVASWAYSR